MDPTAIQLLILDVDGVLTDGRLVVTAEGEPAKSFHVRDGLAIKLWQRTGHRTAVLTGRGGPPVLRRAQELGIAHVRTDASDKLAAYLALLQEARATDGTTAYFGDDLPDLRPMARCALPIAPANAAPCVKQRARLLTRRSGGCGAAAEAVEWLLRKKGLWRRELLEDA